jgi:ferredoxin
MAALSPDSAPNKIVRVMQPLADHAECYAQKLRAEEMADHEAAQKCRSCGVYLMCCDTGAYMLCDRCSVVGTAQGQPLTVAFPVASDIPDMTFEILGGCLLCGACAYLADGALLCFECFFQGYQEGERWRLLAESDTRERALQLAIMHPVPLAHKKLKTGSYGLDAHCLSHAKDDKIMV